MGQLTRNEVFTLAVQRYSDTVYRTAVHNCRCTADAEDVVQDVFEKLLHYNGIFESEEHLKAWLLRVAINRCRDLTRAAHQKDTELDENLPAPDALEEDGRGLDAIRPLAANDRHGHYLDFKRTLNGTTPCPPPRLCRRPAACCMPPARCRKTTAMPSICITTKDTLRQRSGG